MSAVVQANASDDRHILGCQRSKELLDLIFLASGLSEQRALAFQDLDFQATFLGESVDVGLVFGDDGLAVFDAAVFCGDIADETLPGGDGSHG